MKFFRKNLRGAAVRFWGTLLVFGALGFAIGCQSAPQFGQIEVSKTLDTVKLKPGLVIGVSVLVAGKKEIDEPAKRVSERGTIILPLLGEVKVEDQSVEELQAKLKKDYRKYFVEPQVIVDFAKDTSAEGSSPWGFVTVLGRVKTPGRFPLPATRDMTVSGAIQKAGGYASSAKMQAIVVTRTLPDGLTASRTVDLKAVGKDGRVDEDIVLEGNDVVFIPEAIF